MIEVIGSRAESVFVVEVRVPGVRSQEEAEAAVRVALGGAAMQARTVARAADVVVRMPGEGDDKGCWLTEFAAKAMHAERLAGARWETMASSRRWKVMDGTERRFSADQLHAMYSKQVVMP